ncbi:MAG: hypothetical protein FJ190_12680 [Gammaproteobacteria bacterium]|nr:hypothetical protein [Gammaproteobacteria bacterium]
MALHFDYALRLRSNSVKTPGLYGYAGVVVHRSASLASMYSFNVSIQPLISYNATSLCWCSLTAFCKMRSGQWKCLILPIWP